MRWQALRHRSPRGSLCNSVGHERVRQMRSVVAMPCVRRAEMGKVYKQDTWFVKDDTEISKDTSK